LWSFVEFCHGLELLHFRGFSSLILLFLKSFLYP
jgi:hypothetical protein